MFGRKELEIQESCRCGAAIKIAGEWITVAYRLDEFRQHHKICLTK